MTRLAAIALALGAAPLVAQAPNETNGLVDRLREIANRRVLTKAAAGKRAADATAWLATASAKDLGDMAILRALAHTLGADAGQRQRGTAELIDWFREHNALPARGFEEAAGRVVLFDLVKRADSARWQECRAMLPLLLRSCPDHRSAFWLLGRRGRDAGNPEGKQFLQEVVIPALLADPELDDADRVQLLRRLYEVDYTGPKPFVDVAGPGLDGSQVRTVDHRGRVLLVDYWATWCRPCLMALPGIVAAHRKFGGQGFDVIGISIDDADHRERVHAKVKELGIEFPVIFDGKGSHSEITLANKVLAIPATFLIDRSGRVRYTGLEGDELQRRVAELLAEK